MVLDSITSTPNDPAEIAKRIFWRTLNWIRISGNRPSPKPQFWSAGRRLIESWHLDWPDEDYFLIVASSDYGKMFVQILRRFDSPDVKMASEAPACHREHPLDHSSKWTKIDAKDGKELFERLLKLRIGREQVRATRERWGR